MLVFCPMTIVPLQLRDQAILIHVSSCGSMQNKIGVPGKVLVLVLVELSSSFK